MTSNTRLKPGIGFHLKVINRELDAIYLGEFYINELKFKGEKEEKDNNLILSDLEYLRISTIGYSKFFFFYDIENKEVIKVNDRGLITLNKEIGNMLEDKETRINYIKNSLKDFQYISDNYIFANLTAIKMSLKRERREFDSILFDFFNKNNIVLKDL